MNYPFDLNVAPPDQYPIIKVLTRSDMTTSQLVLPRHSVDEFMVPNMPENLRDRLRNGDGRANIWVVDDENRLEHYLTMVDREHRYSIISWGIVRQTRELREGQQIRFRWIENKLHFIVPPEENQNNGGNPPEEQGNNGEKEERTDEKKDEPAAKKRRQEMGKSLHLGAGIDINP